MRVVLKQDYGKLGKAMDIVNVRDGYARNFLIPSGVAIVATEGNVKSVAEVKKVAERREGKRIAHAQELGKKLEQVPCTIAVAVGGEDRMFGSVTTQEISDFLQREGFNIPKQAIELEEPIKQIGVYNVGVRLYRDIRATLRVWVVKDEKKA
jgi:large subunit ribosomal protein L9